MAVNKVVYNTANGAEILMDLTNDTVTPSTLAEGVTAHDASGEEITGTMPTTTVLYTEQTLTEAQKAQARENIGATETYETKADAITKYNQLYAGVADKMQLEPSYANSVDECTDTTKMYVLPDGFIYAHKEGEVIEWENAVPKSTTNDGVTIYGDVVNGKAVGYMNGKYLSGVSQGTDANYVTVGFIPYAAVDGVYPNIYVKGLPWVNESHSRLYLFTSAFGNTWGAGNSLLMEGSTNLLKNFTLTELGDNYWSLTPKDALYSNITAVPAYMRISLKGKGENLIISIGKPIETTITKSWQSTGHAFVPADYENRILALEDQITELRAIINGLI